MSNFTIFRASPVFFCSSAICLFSSSVLVFRRAFNSSCSLFNFTQVLIVLSDGIFRSRDRKFEKYFWLSPYAYCANNPIIYIDPDGRNPILAEDGSFLGTTNDKNCWKGVPIVMSKEAYNSYDKKTGISPDEAKSNGTPLNEYGKGISISNDTWNKIESNGGNDRLTPYVQNKSDKIAYYKPEGILNGVDVNPGYNADGAYPIAPKTDLYVPVDGVKTSAMKADEVYKVADLGRIIINKNGQPDIIGSLETFSPLVGAMKTPDANWHNLRNAFGNVPNARDSWFQSTIMRRARELMGR